MMFSHLWLMLLTLVDSLHLQQVFGHAHTWQPWQHSQVTRQAKLCNDPNSDNQVTSKIKHRRVNVLHRTVWCKKTLQQRASRWFTQDWFSQVLHLKVPLVKTKVYTACPQTSLDSPWTLSIFNKLEWSWMQICEIMISENQTEIFSCLFFWRCAADECHATSQRPNSSIGMHVIFSIFLSQRWVYSNIPSRLMENNQWT